MFGKDTRKYWLWLSHTLGQGSTLAVDLVRFFEDAKGVYDAGDAGVSKSGINVSRRILEKLKRRETDEEEEILRWCDRNSVQVIVPDMSIYPKSLRSLTDAPMVLYCIGELPDLDSYFSCAVVGTRTMTGYGKEMAYKLGAGLADGGAVVVSGLALGVDGMAMAGAVEADGISVGVLGCGIDVVYPAQHAELYRRVRRRGAIITEYAPGSSPRDYHFPVRNRIISGISQATLVVEGDMESGSLITARRAINQGRALYAVPGRVGEKNSEGTNQLLKDGALPVTCAEDILKAYEFIYPHTITLDRLVPHISADIAADNMGVGTGGKRKSVKKAKTENKAPSGKKNVKVKTIFPEEKAETKTVSRRPVQFESLSEDDKRVFEYMKPDVPMLADEITGCGLALPKIMVSLTMLEMAGAVESGAGGYYLRRSADFGCEPEYITEDDDGL